jgi:Cu/Ag efflux protein CusF
MLVAAAVIGTPGVSPAAAQAEGGTTGTRQPEVQGEPRREARGAGQQAAHGDDSAMSEATVRKVDIEARKITLRHGEIQNLGMGAMTMVFGVTDPRLLQQVKADDRIRFRAIERDGRLLVTEIQKGQ